MFAVVFEDRPRLVSDFGMVIYPLSISLPLKREGGAEDAAYYLEEGREMERAWGLRRWREEKSLRYRLDTSTTIRAEMRSKARDTYINMSNYHRWKIMRMQ